MENLKVGQKVSYRDQVWTILFVNPNIETVEVRNEQHQYLSVPFSTIKPVGEM